MKKSRTKSLLELCEPPTPRMKTCRKGHQYDATKRGCKWCRNEAARKRYWSNPEKFREKSRKIMRKRRAANPEKFRENDRKKRAANPEKFRERARRRREANPEKAREICRRSAHKMRQANPQKSREDNCKNMRKWREANPEKDRENRRRSYWKNPEKYRNKCLKWEKANPDKVCANAAHKRAMHKDAFQLESADARITEIHKPQPCATCGQHCENPTTGHILPEKRFGLHIPSVLYAQCSRCQGIQGTKDHPEPLRSLVIAAVKAELESPEVAPKFIKWALDGGLDRFPELATIGLFSDESSSCGSLEVGGDINEDRQACDQEGVEDCSVRGSTGGQSGSPGRNWVEVVAGT